MPAAQALSAWMRLQKSVVELPGSSQALSELEFPEACAIGIKCTGPSCPSLREPQGMAQPTSAEATRKPSGLSVVPASQGCYRGE